MNDQLDAYDDGSSPWTLGGPEPYWSEFKKWAVDDLGQAYSLAVCEGLIVDNVTFWAFRGFQAGRRMNEAP